ncbi:MAG: Na+-transporting NADH:ubiquinone oxidoreductase subunit [Clostridiales bacterium]|jgi:Na+-transporting NADH:ubiquinone oxidoreductase subunit F|nr:Na+-transporting NADH:ubiquinone oxidoreductase subunit [Clostridiales bacterium]MDN5282924.1 Na+-transporting NADH:ubiquinone oxidoreductase subunit [Candidatus Ozemobacter sp.]
MQFLTVFLMVNSFILVLCSLIAISSYFLKQSGKVKLRVNESDLEDVERGVTLFDALAENGIYLPAACGGKGTCGRCLVKCSEGGGPLTPMERLALSAQELDSGCRLACQIKIRESVVLKLPQELLSAKKYKARLVYGKYVGDGIRLMNFELEENQTLHFRPGQYVQVYRQLPHERIVRAYSISSPASQKKGFSLDVQFVAGGIMSGYLNRLPIGEELEISGPYGDMAFETDQSDSPVVLVAGGVGLAPIRSILYSIIEMPTPPKVYLFWGARYRVNLYAENELRELAETNSDWLLFIPALSGALIEEGWTGATGFIHEAVEASLPEMKDGRAFICGPGPMMDAVTEVLQKKGLRPDNIKADPFDFN